MTTGIVQRPTSGRLECGVEPIGLLSAVGLSEISELIAGPFWS
jgi:hypothetical protein